MSCPFASCSSSLCLPYVRSLRPGYTRRRYIFGVATSFGDSNLLIIGKINDDSPLRVAFRRAASCDRASSLAGHPGPPAFGECALICAWRASRPRLRRPSWPSPRSLRSRRRRKASSKPRCGSDGLQVRTNGKSFGRRFLLRINRSHVLAFLFHPSRGLRKPRNA